MRGNPTSCLYIVTATFTIETGHRLQCEVPAKRGAKQRLNLCPLNHVRVEALQISNSQAPVEKASFPSSSLFYVIV